MGIDDTLAALLRHAEERLLETSVRNNPEEVDRLLHGRFVEFGSSGRVWNRREIIDLLADDAPAQRSLEDFAFELLGPGVALVTYRVVRQLPATGTTNRSSIWVLVGSEWKMRFHQGTSVVPANTA